MKLVSLKNISFAYPNGSALLDQLNFELYSGERVGIIGPNGSGKTTLAHIIMGLIKPRSGLIEIFGQKMSSEEDFQKIRPRIGFVFQNADDQLIYPTVLEDVAFGPLNLGHSPEKAKELARAILAKLGLSEFEQRFTHNLSGGEKKLVSIATVLVMEPEALIFDEPTTGLDEQTRRKLIKIIQDLDIAQVIISHDYDFLAQTTKKQYLMKQGKLVYDESVVMHKHIHVHPLGQVPHKHEEG